MTGSGAQRTTIVDVARAAGVHFSTASKVLRDVPGYRIRPETRARVREAAERLDYRPSAVARALRSASSGAIGMLVPSLRNPVYAEIARGAFERAWERELVVVLGEDRDGADAERAYDRLVQNSRIDGLLVASAHPGSILPSRVGDAPVPFVFLNRRQPGAQSVSMREEEAAALAAEHLLALGHRRLGHVAGPRGIDTAARRLAAFRAAVRAGGGTLSVVHADFDERAGHDATAELLARRRPPTAIFASNLNQAIGALAAARAAGRAVPRELSLLTYDDDPICDYLDPPLTAIRMPLHELGVAAVDALLARIDDAPADDLVLATPPRLIERRSTAPAAA